MYCPECGAACREGAKFCPNCGSVLEGLPTPAGAFYPTPPETIQPTSPSAKGGRNRAVLVILGLAVVAFLAWKLSAHFASHPDVRGSWSGSMNVSAMGMTTTMPINLNIQEESKGGDLKGTLSFEGQEIAARGQASGKEVNIRANLQSSAMAAFVGSSTFPLTLKGELQGDHIQGSGHLESPVKGAFDLGSFDLQRPEGVNQAQGTTPGPPRASNTSKSLSPLASNVGESSAHYNPSNPGHLRSVSVDSPNEDVVIHGEQRLSRDLICKNLTIAAGATLVTFGYSIICSGDFLNSGAIVTGLVINGGNGEAAQGGSLPNSYGGSGGGGEGGGGLWGASGGRTREPGGMGGPNDGIGQDGRQPTKPLLNAGLLQKWSKNDFSSLLSGAGGGVNGGGVWERGGNGAYGLYVQAEKLVAGDIEARGEDGRGQSPGLPGNGAGSGGGGGGAIVLAYGFGGYLPGRYDVSGGKGGRGWGSGGGARGGRGGDGQILTFAYGFSAPVSEVSEKRNPEATYSPADGTPAISGVTFQGWGRTLGVEVVGKGFGKEPRSMPFTGNLPCFAFNDEGRFEAGSSKGGDAVGLHYVSWNDTKIVIHGFSGAYGGGLWSLAPNNPVIITVMNPTSKKEAQWTGQVPYDMSSQLTSDMAEQAEASETNTPVIDNVIFQGGGRDLVILVRGKGFGAPPRLLPYDGDLPCFAFGDEQRGWQAGYSSGGNAVGLKYRLWMPGAIIIKGFSGSYGYGSWVVRSGDRVAITVWNPTSHQKAEWRGTLP